MQSGAVTNYAVLIGEALNIDQAAKPVLGQIPFPRPVAEVLDVGILNVRLLVKCEDFRRSWIGSCGGPSQICVGVILFAFEDKVRRRPDWAHREEFHKCVLC